MCSICGDILIEEINRLFNANQQLNRCERFFSTAQFSGIVRNRIFLRTLVWNVRIMFQITLCAQIFRFSTFKATLKTNTLQALLYYPNDFRLFDLIKL